jgi:sensor domain CHASE-containing protein
MKELLTQPFFQVTLPLMVTFVATIWVASWAQNKRIEDLRDSINKRLDAIEARLGKIEARLENFAERIVRLEERTSPLAR